MGVYGIKTKQKPMGEFMKCADNSSIVKRLNRIEGQIKGIKKMLEDDKTEIVMSSENKL